jgi:hypothetical protein
VQISLVILGELYHQLLGIVRGADCPSAYHTRLVRPAVEVKFVGCSANLCAGTIACDRVYQPRFSVHGGHPDRDGRIPFQSYPLVGTQELEELLQFALQESHRVWMNAGRHFLRRACNPNRR